MPYYSHYFDYARVFDVEQSGQLSSYNGNHSGDAAAPVINLAAEYVMDLKGEGTQSAPYYLGN